ncbi:helix-turn-helix domain-containing protein [Streptomyces pathocidini]|uniref:TetR/AcrR family transcriptional regulator n=1 Tax=Streptomyces pathocidini TaxID=1650571 RepID=UPI0033D9E242
MDGETTEGRVLDAAEELFYARGVRAVGMDAVRAASGVSLKRLYQLYPSKDDLVEAYLRRRDTRWLRRLAEHVAKLADRPDTPDVLAKSTGAAAESTGAVAKSPGAPAESTGTVTESPGEAAESPGVPVDRILAVFDWLHQWFAEEGYRGCAFINSYGELGATSPAVAEVARAHKAAFRRYLSDLVAAAGLPAPLAAHLTLLAEGAITTAAISGSPAAAHEAKAAARILLEASRASAPEQGRT